MEWFETEGGNLGYGIPGQQPVYEYLPATNEFYSYRGGQIPPAIRAKFPGATVRDVQTDPAFSYGRKDDFMGKLGDYAVPLMAGGLGAMIAPWAAAGYGMGGTAGGAGAISGGEGLGDLIGNAGADTLGAELGGYGGAWDPAVAEGAFEGLGGIAPAAGAGSFLNADGTFGSTAANSGVGGAGAQWGTGAGTGSLPWVTGETTGGGAGATTIESLKNILANGGSVDDWLKTAGAVGPALLGAYASNEQASSLGDLARKYEAYGAPSRGRYEASFAPGFSMESDPGYKDALDQAAKATLNRMSANFGSPSGSPNAWAATLQDLYKGTAYPALQNYRSQNANAGGISSFNSAVPGLQTGQLQAQGNIYNALGSGVANIFNPPQTLADIIRQFKTAGG